jgi:sugar phosphate isomerase/epimerase
MDQRHGHDISRRRFLQLSAAAGLAGLPVLLGAADKKADKADPLGGFTLGVQSYSFRNFDLEPALKRTQDLGLHYIELYQKHCPLESTPEQIQAVLRLCKDYDITPVAYGVQHFTKDHDANKKMFDFGKALGIRTFSASPDPDSFDSLDKLCDEYKISIGIHPHGPQGDKLDRWYSAEIILEAVKDHNPLIGSCLDTGHLIRAAILGKQLDPAKEIRIMGARNFGIHLKDNDNEAEKNGVGGGNSNVVFGKGVLDVPAVLKALRDVKYKGYISIEYEAHADDPSPDMKACVEVFKESVKKLA